MNTRQKEALKQLMVDSTVVFDEPMKKHTTFLLLGKGSNVLVGDNGIRGITACFGETLSSITRRDNMLIAEAGASLAAVANMALQKELTGFEFAAGIPGSVGGALRMNAGAYRSENTQKWE